jgi:hypothetical protein
MWPSDSIDVADFFIRILRPIRTFRKVFARKTHGGFSDEIIQLHLLVRLIRNISDLREPRSAPWTEPNFNDGRSAIMDNQAESSPNGGDQSVRAVVPAFMQITPLVQIVIHSVAAVNTQRRTPGLASTRLRSIR